MSLLSDLFVAHEAEAARYDAGRNLPPTERVEFNGLTFEELADLWSVLEASERTREHASGFEQIFIADGGQRLIHRLPGGLVDRLASLDAAAIEHAASLWVKTGELAYMNCDASDVVPVIEAAANLAKNAARGGKSVYLWMCV